MLSVSVSYLILIRKAHWELIQEVACLRHRTIWIVSGEHDPVSSDLKIQIEECLCKVKTAERVVNILSEVVCNSTLKLRHVRRQSSVDSGHNKRKSFPHMTDHDLKVRKSVESSTDDEAEDMDRGFDMPAPCMPG